MQNTFTKPKNMGMKIVKVGEIPEYCLEPGSMPGRKRGRASASMYTELVKKLEGTSATGLSVLVEHSPVDRKRLTALQKFRAYLAHRGYTLRTKGESDSLTWLWLEPLVPSSPMGKGWICGLMGIPREACPFSPSSHEYDLWMEGHGKGTRTSYRECS